MNIIDCLPLEDMVKLNSYINYYGGGLDTESYMDISRMPYFLRYWKTAKEPFYKMFGEQFIIKREIVFDKDPGIMVDEMENLLCYGNPTIREFIRKYGRHISSLYEDLTNDEIYSLKRFVNDDEMLVNNIYDGDPICIPGKLTANKHPLQINKGAKAIKMLGKICQALNITYTEYRCPYCGRTSITHNDVCPYCGQAKMELKDGYESFRQAHSLILNQKKIRGNLCLSIHPLDFITMSDNASGWESCMRWMDSYEPGEYRLGTIEMMNSPYVVIAYVEAKDNMIICDRYEWNNKRWRQLIVMTPELMLGNKQYPYVNDYLQGAAMKWLRELANNYERPDTSEPKYGPYEQEAIQVVNKHRNHIGTNEVYINLRFDYMYNDIYDTRLAFLASNFNQTIIDYNLSGPAVCTNCGEIIYYDSNDTDPSWTVCRECCGMWKCTCCGTWCSGEPNYVGDSDECYCDYCYRYETVICEVCGERVSHTQPVYIQLIPDTDARSIEDAYNWHFVIDNCNNCLGSREFTELFGEISPRYDAWCRYRDTVYIDNITDEGLTRGDLSPARQEMLRTVREMKSREERIEFLQKNLF